MEIVAITLLERMKPFGVIAAMELFNRARSVDGEPFYEVRLCAERPRVKVGPFEVGSTFGLEEAGEAATLVVPSLQANDVVASAALSRTLHAAHERGARVASICTGSFVLASSGLLDGRWATTNWQHTRELAARYPQVNVNHDVLSVTCRNVTTSAGTEGALGMCLDLIGEDHGPAVAAGVARSVALPVSPGAAAAQPAPVLPVDRDAQFSALMGWIAGNLRSDLTLNAICARAGMTHRTLHRRFQDRLRTTPLRWIQEARVRRAQELLVATSLSVEQVGLEVGFRNVQVFRDSFSRVAGSSPSAFRRAAHAMTRPPTGAS